MVKITSLFIKSGSALEFSFGVRAQTEIRGIVLKTCMLNVASSGKKNLVLKDLIIFILYPPPAMSAMKRQNRKNTSSTR